MLPPNSVCFHCGQSVSMAREISIIRNAWELLHPLEADADTISAERHLHSQFTIPPTKSGLDGQTTPSHNGQRNNSQLPIQGASSTSHHSKLAIPDHGSSDYLPPISQVISSPVSPISSCPSGSLRAEKSATETSTYLDSLDRERTRSQTFAQPPQRPTNANHRTHAHARHDLLTRRRSEAAAEKGRSRWKFSFGSMRRAPPPVSGDTSSLSSGDAENQKLDEIALGGLTIGSKSGRGKAPKTTNIALSQNSTLAIFWTHSALQIWDVGTSPPTMSKAITTESTCILAAVAKSHAAYIIGTRDQKLTVRHQAFTARITTDQLPS